MGGYGVVAAAVRGGSCGEQRPHGWVSKRQRHPATDSRGGPSGAPGHTEGRLIIAALGVPQPGCWSARSARVAPSRGVSRSGARLLPPWGVRGGLAGSKASFSM